VPPLGPAHYGHVYVIGFADYVKIGWSEHVEERLFDIQKHAPEKLVLYTLFAAKGVTPIWKVSRPAPACVVRYPVLALVLRSGIASMEGDLY
jgi:hypothetical protein